MQTNAISNIPTKMVIFFLNKGLSLTFKRSKNSGFFVQIFNICFARSVVCLGLVFFIPMQIQDCQHWALVFCFKIILPYLFVIDGIRRKCRLLVIISYLDLTTLTKSVCFNKRGWMGIKKQMKCACQRNCAEGIGRESVIIT